MQTFGAFRVFDPEFLELDAVAHVETQGEVPVAARFGFAPLRTALETAPPPNGPGGEMGPSSLGDRKVMLRSCRAACAAMPGDAYFLAPWSCLA